jgi:hypothetical protein
MNVGAAGHAPKASSSIDRFRLVETIRQQLKTRPECSKRASAAGRQLTFRRQGTTTTDLGHLGLVVILLVAGIPIVRRIKFSRIVGGRLFESVCETRGC